MKYLYDGQYLTCADCKFHECRNGCMRESENNTCRSRCTYKNRAMQCSNEICKHFVFEKIEGFELD